MIPEKANRILNLILLLMVLIVLRIWHLAVIQYDAKLDESRKPQRRITVEAARRATIRDRFNIPLAINKIQYNVAILYSQMRQIPAIGWSTDENGKRVKRFKRKEYITALSRLLADELQLDADRLEDLIHSKAALYYSIPFVIKEEISEQEYYRLKMLEKDWMGIHVQRVPKRTYPKGRVAADIIGYMGAINKQEYEGIIHEIKALQTYLQQYDVGDDLPLPTGIASPNHARRRLKELLDMAYTANDYVGKSGIEGHFEEELRGFQGKKSYYSDARGNYLRELPGSRDPMPGQRLLLTISSELQEYAEQLLMQNDRIREARISHPNQTHKESRKQPWIKGGAIIAIDPNNGDLLAMASYPRFDPNDFIASGNSDLQAQKRANIARWFESDDYIGQIWDQKRPLERERFDDELMVPYDENLLLTWEAYLDFVLAVDSPVKKGLIRIGTIKSAIELQKAFGELRNLSDQENSYWLMQLLYPGDEHILYGKRIPLEAKQKIELQFVTHGKEVTRIRKVLDKFLNDLPQHYDKVLLIDMCRLAVLDDRFKQNLIETFGKQSLSDYRNASAALATIEPVVRSMSKTLFHDNDFKQWRRLNEQTFLKQKRAEEVLTLRYPKPYIDYLDAMENTLFKIFWEQNRWHLITLFLTGKREKVNLDVYTDFFSAWQRELHEGLHQVVSWRQAYITLQEVLSDASRDTHEAYLKSMRNYNELTRPLLGRYRHLRQKPGKQLEKHLAAAFYPVYGFGYGRSYAYRQAASQGSLFKLVTAYAALVQRYQQLKPSAISLTNLNPLEITDCPYKHGKETYLGYHADGSALPQIYKGGRLPKSSAQNIGKTDILHALEMSSNPYFALLAGDVLNSPQDLATAASNFSYGSRTGIDLPGEISGKIPTDLLENKTGLYAFAIGQHSFVVTPLQTSVMLSAIANGGTVITPKIVSIKAGAAYENESRVPYPVHFSYQDSFASVGIDFPLFTSTLLCEKPNHVQHVSTEVQRQLFMPAMVRHIILEGMHRVVDKMQQEGLSNLSHFYQDYPEAISDYLELKDQLVGKTSTAESMECIDLDLLQGTNMYTHVWFGGITFDSSTDQKQSFLIRDSEGKPELVVVVYLRYGRFGREGAPVAAQIVKKWREIKQKRKI